MRMRTIKNLPELVRTDEKSAGPCEDQAWQDVQKLVVKYPRKTIGVALAMGALLALRSNE